MNVGRVTNKRAQSLWGRQRLAIEKGWLSEGLRKFKLMVYYEGWSSSKIAPKRVEEIFSKLTSGVDGRACTECWMESAKISLTGMLKYAKDKGIQTLEAYLSEHEVNPFLKSGLAYPALNYVTVTFRMGGVSIQFRYSFDKQEYLGVENDYGQSSFVHSAVCW